MPISGKWTRPPRCCFGYCKIALVRPCSKPTPHCPLLELSVLAIGEKKPKGPTEINQNWTLPKYASKHHSSNLAMLNSNSTTPTCLVLHIWEFRVIGKKLTTWFWRHMLSSEPRYSNRSAGKTKNFQPQNVCQSPRNQRRSWMRILLLSVLPRCVNHDFPLVEKAELNALQ